MLVAARRCRAAEDARKVGAHTTSLLQDLERGRPMEIDPLVTGAQEMRPMTSVSTPEVDSVMALVTQRAKLARLYEERALFRAAEAKVPAFA